MSPFPVRLKGFDLRCGGGRVTALTCPRHVIHSRSRSNPSDQWQNPDVPPARHSLPLPFESLGSMAKPRHPKRDTEVLVRVKGFEPPASWSQTTRATNCATPGRRQKKLAPLPFCAVCVRAAKTSISVPSFFLSKSNPRRWASIWKTREKKETRSTAVLRS